MAMGAKHLQFMHPAGSALNRKVLSNQPTAERVAMANFIAVTLAIA
jgi:hypothetical protein